MVESQVTTTDGTKLVKYVQNVGTDGTPTPGGASTSDAQYVNSTRVNPEWAHVIDEEPFSAQAVDATSTLTDVLGYYDIGFNITDAVCDGVLTVLDEDDATLQFKLNGADVTSFTGAASGTNVHACQLVNCKPKQIKFKLTGRSTGSMSVHLKAL